MDKFDRIFRLHTILASRKTPISLEDLMAKLECSKSTLHRAVNALKDNLHAPVIFDAQGGGYRYAEGPKAMVCGSHPGSSKLSPFYGDCSRMSVADCLRSI
jgi:biotin operon repressor